MREQTATLAGVPREPRLNRITMTDAFIPSIDPGAVTRQRYTAEAIAAAHISGDGRFTKKCHEFLEHELGVGKRAADDVLHPRPQMAALLLDIGPA